MSANQGQRGCYVAQMPKVTCTFTDLRKLYIRPGDNMRTPGEHLQSILRPKHPDHPDTTLEWLTGKS